MAYDTLAPDYDELVREDQPMREVLWKHYQRVVQPGNRVLELGCGTGLDTLFLARYGARVTAIDASHAMIARLLEKAEKSQLDDRIEAQVNDINLLNDFPSASYDAIVSAFAALNTVANLEKLAEEAARILRPGGRMIVHLLAPAGLWEKRGPEETVGMNGHPVKHHLPSVDEAIRFFNGPLHLRRAYGLGFLWPRWVGRRVPLVVARPFGHLEARLGVWPPFLNWGRFFVLDLENRASKTSKEHRT